MSVQLFLADYSKYSFIVSGDSTKDYKEEFKNMGGRWNPNLSLNGTSIKGWVFSLKKKDEVQTFLESSKEPLKLPVAEVVIEKYDKSTQTEPEDIVDIFKNLVVESPPILNVDNTFFKCDCGTKVLRKNKARHLTSLTHTEIMASKLPFAEK